MNKLSLALVFGVTMLALSPSLLSQRQEEKRELIDCLVSSQIAEKEELAPLLDSLSREQGASNLGKTVSLSLASGRELAPQRISPRGDAPGLIAVIETILKPQPDSRLLLCSLDESARPSAEGKQSAIWKEVKGVSLIEPAPRAEDFLPQGQAEGGYAFGRLSELLYPLHLIYSWDATTADLLIEVSLLQSYEDRANQELQALIRQLPKLRYSWRDGAFRLKRAETNTRN